MFGIFDLELVERNTFTVAFGTKNAPKNNEICPKYKRELTATTVGSINYNSLTEFFFLLLAASKFIWNYPTRAAHMFVLLGGLVSSYLHSFCIS